MWDMAWKWAMEHYIFHFIVLIVMVFLLFGKKYFKIKINKEGVSVENAIQLDPKSLCPYINPHPKSTEAIDKNTKAIDELITKLDEILIKSEKSQSAITELRINDLKSSFWNLGQPLGDRLKDGLEYVSVHKKNGDTRAAVIKTACENYSVYEGVTAGREFLKLPEVKRIEVKP